MMKTTSPNNSATPSLTEAGDKLTRMRDYNYYKISTVPVLINVSQKNNYQPWVAQVVHYLERYVVIRAKIGSVKEMVYSTIKLLSTVHCYHVYRQSLTAFLIRTCL